MRLLAIFCVALHLSACTTVAPLPLEPHALERTLHPGDQVTITDKRGAASHVTVTSVTADGICHADGCIQLTEMDAISRHEPDAARTGALTVLAVIGVAAFAALVVAAVHGARDVGAAYFARTCCAR